VFPDVPLTSVHEPRPRVVAFAAAFGALATAEVLFFVVLFLVQDPRLDRVVVVLLVLLVGAATGSLLVLQGRRRGWLVLTGSAVGPVGCLVLAPRRSVRRWRRSGPTRRSAGGRRSAASSG
jgi:hypothetical protein